MDKISLFLITVASIIGLSACQKDELQNREYPTIATSEVTNISADGATFNATITSGNPEMVTEYGFVWGRSDNLDLEGNEKVIINDELTGNGFSYKVTFALVAMRDYYVRSYIKSGDYVIYGNPIVFKSLGSQSPFIEDFEPKSATWGDTIIISGKNFSALKSINWVYFGAVRTQVIFATIQVLKVLVPQTASQPTSAISVEVYGNRTVSPQTFHLITPVTLNSISKNLITWNDTLEISGTFSQTTAVTAFLGSSQIEIFKSEENRISFIVPSDLRFQDSLETGVIVDNHRIELQHKLLMIKPVISAIYPSIFGWGDTIRLSGYFNPIPEQNRIYLSGTSCKILEVGLNSLVCIVPPVESFSADLSYASCSRIFTYRTVDFTDPVIYDVYPRNAYTYEYVYITGSNFFPGKTTVNVNGLQATLTKITEKEIVFRVPDYISAEPDKLIVNVLDKRIESDLLDIRTFSIEDVTPHLVTFGDIVEITGPGSMTLK